MVGEDKIQRKRKFSLGFSLVEMTVVLSIVLTLAALAMDKYTAAKLEYAERETKYRMDYILEEMRKRAKHFGRIPCPADLLEEDFLLDGVTGKPIVNQDLGKELRHFDGAGKPDGCDASSAGVYQAVDPGSAPGDPNIFWGAVPTRTLQLPESYMYDGFGRRFVYVVDQRATITDAFIPEAAFALSAYGSNGNIKLQRSIFPGGLPSEKRIVYGETDVLSPSDYSKEVNYEVEPVSPAPLPEHLPGMTIALISHGPNGHGGYARGDNGIPFRVVVSGITNKDELDNCHCTAAGSDKPAAFMYNLFTMSGFSPVTLDPSNTETSTFDDIVRFKSRAMIGEHWQPVIVQ